MRIWNLLLFWAIFGVTLGAKAETSKCGNSGNELFNLTWEMHEEYKKSKSAKAVMDKYKDQLFQKTDELDKISEKYPECRDKFKAIVSEAMLNLKDIQAEVNKSPTESVSYDEWFTLHNTGIKSGKKYSFVGCVIGPRNATAVRCHVPGTTAKRVFYNLDDIQSQEMRVKWLNTNNKDMCVTAYVTGGEAFVVSIAEPSSCK